SAVYGLDLKDAQAVHASSYLSTIAAKISKIKKAEKTQFPLLDCTVSCAITVGSILGSAAPPANPVWATAAKARARAIFFMGSSKLSKELLGRSGRLHRLTTFAQSVKQQIKC
ncbi:MAG: hypothetical protein ACPGNR_12370, partial [Paracoccaceae bacterium]